MPSPHHPVDAKQQQPHPPHSAYLSSSSSSLTPNATPKVLPYLFQDASLDDVLVLVADMLVRLIQHNDSLPLHPSSLTRFHSRATPNISLSAYLGRIAKYTSVEKCCMLILLVYIDRVCERMQGFTICGLTVHRFVCAAILCASKALCDAFNTNEHYARVGGISLAEMNLLEKEFLNIIDWRLICSGAMLQHYYTSLVRSHNDFVLADPPLHRFESSANVVSSKPSSSSLSGPSSPTATPVSNVGDCNNNTGSISGKVCDLRAKTGLRGGNSSSSTTSNSPPLTTQLDRHHNDGGGLASQVTASNSSSSSSSSDSSSASLPGQALTMDTVSKHPPPSSCTASAAELGGDDQASFKTSPTLIRSSSHLDESEAIGKKPRQEQVATSLQPLLHLTPSIHAFSSSSNQAIKPSPRSLHAFPPNCTTLSSLVHEALSQPTPPAANPILLTHHSSSYSPTSYPQYQQQPP